MFRYKHFIFSPRGVRFDSISAVEEEIDNEFQEEFNNQIQNQISRQVAQFEHSVEEDWVPEELKQLLEEDPQNENEQNLQFSNETKPAAVEEKQRIRRQNITINIDPDALLERVKQLRNPHKALRKKILKRNHKLKLRAMRELGKKRRYKEKGRERKNA